MSTLVKAQETAAAYYFEVCPGKAARCSHDKPELEHRLYTWSRRGLVMTPAQLKDEVRLLESLLITEPTTTSIAGITRGAI